MKINNAAPVIKNNNIKNNKKAAFKGLPKSVTNFISLDRQGPMVRSLFLFNAFTFLLGSRIVTSRDKDEKREIIVRDVPTIFIAVAGVPIISKFFAKIIQDKSGFAIMKDSGPSWLDKLMDKMTGKDMIPHDQLETLYKYDKNLASGMAGFSKRLRNFGGNLKKIYSSLGKEIAEKLKSFKNNKEIIEALSEEKKDVPKNKELSDMLIKALSDDKNAALKKAGFLRTIPTLIGFGLTLVSIGIIIPKLNIALTEYLNKNKNNKNETAKAD